MGTVVNEVYLGICLGILGYFIWNLGLFIILLDLIAFSGMILLFALNLYGVLSDCNPFKF